MRHGQVQQPMWLPQPCGRIIPHAAPHVALLCGSIHAHFAAGNAPPHALLNTNLLSQDHYLESRFINALCTTLVQEGRFIETNLAHLLP
jgi:hypothetical protein